MLEDERQEFLEYLGWHREDLGLTDLDDAEMDINSLEYIPKDRAFKIDYNLDTFEFPTSFVSIDFENLYQQRVFACSVGMVKYKNGVKQDEFYRIIRPPLEYEGKKGKALTEIHGFTEADFEGEETFDKILPKMEAFIEGLPLVAHNAPVERACIRDCCKYYHINTIIKCEDILDTYLLAKKVEKDLGFNIKGRGLYKLNIVCRRMGVKELQHHHACEDAEMCGNLFLVLPKYRSGELKIDPEELEREIEECKRAAVFAKQNSDKYKELESQGHINLRGNILKKDLTEGDPSNPFYNRKVVITGIFNIGREELACRLKKMGADIDTGIGKKTSYLLIGNDPGPSKLKKFDQLIEEGKDVKKIYQADLDLILAGRCFAEYHTEPPVSSKIKTKKSKK